MNVAFDSWIPVITTTKEHKLISLREVLSAGEKYADLAVRPHERVALMRLFICVAHAALDGPKDEDEWYEVPKKLPDASIDYLEKWKDSFELFHPEKPWLQIAGLTGEKTSPTTLLDFKLATGRNPTLHDHFGQSINRELSDAELALALLTYQNFSPGGGLPIAQWGAVKTSQVGNPDAPCLSQSMAHCLLRGKYLLETIHLNIPSFEDISRAYKGCIEYKKNNKEHKFGYFDFQYIEVGKPVWEFFPDTPDITSPAAENATARYLGRLAPISRWIRIIDRTKMYCCCGFKYNTFRDGFPAEPTASVRTVTKKDAKGAETVERAIVRVDPVKSLWRELSALLVKRSAFGLGGPLSVVNAPYDSGFDFQVCAITRDQASMDIAVEAVFHISPLFQNCLSTYQAEVEFAEFISHRVGWAIESYRRETDDNWLKILNGDKKVKNTWELKAKLHATATSHYWTAVEKNLSLLMAHIDAIGTDSAILTRTNWRKMVFSSACDAYRVACGQDTPRQMRAFAKGWQKLVTSENKKNVKEENA